MTALLLSALLALGAANQPVLLPGGAGTSPASLGLTAEAGGVLTGEASWYDDGPGLYGAVHSYRWGDKRYRVRVCRTDGAACVIVTVRDHMANRVRAIDLSPDAFVRLAPLSRGVVQVTVTPLGAEPTIRLPETSTED